MENGKVGIRRRFNILDRGLKGQTMNYDTFNRARRSMLHTKTEPTSDVKGSWKHYYHIA